VLSPTRAKAALSRRGEQPTRRGITFLTMLGHSIVERDRSATSIVVSETATLWAAVLFGGFAVLSVVLYRGIASAVMALYLASWAIYASVASEFVADCRRQELVVRRHIGPLSIKTVYPASSIAQIYVRRTYSKGSGLALRLKSGHSKGLTMSLGRDGDLDALAGSLNHFLSRSRRTARSIAHDIGCTSDDSDDRLRAHRG
jgi:hypothetical protein